MYYRILAEQVYSAFLFVEADSPDEAKEKALEHLDTPVGSMLLDDNPDPIEVAVVSDWTELPEGEEAI